MFLSRTDTVDTVVDTAVGTTACTTVDTAVSIVFSNTVRAKRSEDRHRMTPIGVLRHIGQELLFWSTGKSYVQTSSKSFTAGTSLTAGFTILGDDAHLTIDLLILQLTARGESCCADLSKL